jgi:hypothetical protein
MSRPNFTNGADMKYFQVPVIVVFTKYDQFRMDTEMQLEDQLEGHSKAELEAEMETIFKDRYLTNIRGAKGCPSPPYVRLESENTYQLPSTTLNAVLKKCITLANDSDAMT